MGADLSGRLASRKAAKNAKNAATPFFASLQLAVIRFEILPRNTHLRIISSELQGEAPHATNYTQYIDDEIRVLLL
jgi:hypothetical protein